MQTLTDKQLHLIKVPTLSQGADSPAVLRELVLAENSRGQFDFRSMPKFDGGKSACFLVPCSDVVVSARRMTNNVRPATLQSTALGCVAPRDTAHKA